jgi:hypothetical protein
MFSWKSTKTEVLILGTEIRIINISKSLQYNIRLSMIIFSALMDTTFQTMHLVKGKILPLQAWQALEDPEG